MPGHQHTEVSTHTCTHQTHLTSSEVPKFKAVGAVPAMARGPWPDHFFTHQTFIATTKHDTLKQ